MMRSIKKWMTAIVTAIVLTQTMVASDVVFVYNTSEKQGMKIALADEKGNYAEVGQLFQSDYGQWGSQKKMYCPMIWSGAEGRAVAVFQVNDFSPCFAVAVSDDWVNWRPQDYPHTTVKGCVAPVVAPNANGSFTVVFKTTQGSYRKLTADAQVRHFTTDVPATQQEYERMKPKQDTVTVGGKAIVGYRIALPNGWAQRIRQHFAEQGEKHRRTLVNLKKEAETMVLPEGEVLHATLKIKGNEQKAISDQLIGVFFEDISYAADGGLYAEMVQNRDFEYCAADRRGWKATTAWHGFSTAKIATETPLSKHNPHYMVMGADTLVNEGWDGMVVRSGEKYRFSIYARVPSGKKKRLGVALMDGNKVLAQAELTAKGKEWKAYEVTLQAQQSADKAVLRLVAARNTEVHVDMVSLFPHNTFCHRKNGMRADLAQAIADLHPKFVRFPGGCMSHGDGIDNIYHWHHSVGPLHERVPDRNIWHYHQTKGMGFYEMFQFCEDIGAEPLPVLAAGVPCQNSSCNAEGFGGQQGGIPMEQMPAYIDELCNMIEWANGDPATNKWAAMRAEAGHPEPFHLKYIGIGNEDIISTVFEERCLMIARAIKERYPDIQICGTAGPFHAPSSDYVEGWRFAHANKDVFQLIDEHYYESVGWFLANADYYDHYDRQGPKVYLGEYAAREGKGGVNCALAEAYHLCNVERNGDVVAMTSYAPLLSKNGHSNWSPDMIYFSNTAVQTTASYETQRLFGTYTGNRYITNTLEADSVVRSRVATSVVRDTQTGKTCLRVVNVLPKPLQLTLSTPQLAVGTRVSYEGFKGKPGDTRIERLKGTEPVRQDDALTVTVPAYGFVNYIF